MANDIARGNCKGLSLIEITLSPVSVSNATTAEQTFTVKGLQLHDFVSVAAAPQAGLGISAARVSAADTLAITFGNVTAATITPTASTVYQLMHIRPSNVPVPTAFG
jgi:hypothetical protein